MLGLGNPIVKVPAELFPAGIIMGMIYPCACRICDLPSRLHRACRINHILIKNCMPNKASQLLVNIFFIGSANIGAKIGLNPHLRQLFLSLDAALLRVIIRSCKPLDLTAVLLRQLSGIGYRNPVI